MGEILLIKGCFFFSTFCNKKMRTGLLIQRKTDWDQKVQIYDFALKKTLTRDKGPKRLLKIKKTSEAPQKAGELPFRIFFCRFVSLETSPA